MDNSPLKSIASLMREHRLIERMLIYIKSVTKNIEDKNEIDPTIIDIIVDFFSTFTDRHHHGKEENILFKALDTKALEIHDLKEMEELIKEHEQARENVGKLLNAKQRYTTGDITALDEITSILKEFGNFYPKHINIEDTDFFPAAANYLSDQEIEKIEKQFDEIDKSRIFERYENIVGSLRFGD